MFFSVQKRALAFITLQYRPGFCDIKTAIGIKAPAIQTNSNVIGIDILKWQEQIKELSGGQIDTTNNQMELNSGDIRAAFEAKNTVMLQADWTLPDSEIADYLASFGRFGIPFNILYYPDGQPPVIFDELLTKEKIVSALDKLN